MFRLIMATTVLATSVLIGYLLGADQWSWLMGGLTVLTAVLILSDRGRHDPPAS